MSIDTTRIPAYRAWNTRLKRMADVLTLDLDPETGGVEVLGGPVVQNVITGAYAAERVFWPWSEVELREMGSVSQHGHRDRAAMQDFLGLMTSVGEEDTPA